MNLNGVQFLYRFQRSALTCRSHEGVQTHTVREWPLGALELMEAWWVWWLPGGSLARVSRSESNLLFVGTILLWSLYSLKCDTCWSVLSEGRVVNGIGLASRVCVCVIHRGAWAKQGSTTPRPCLWEEGWQWLVLNNRVRYGASIYGNK